VRRKRPFAIFRLPKRTMRTRGLQLYLHSRGEKIPLDRVCLPPFLKTESLGTFVVALLPRHER